MPDLWMDVDVALAEVPVNILPLIDDSDFKSREVSIAYNQESMDLVWNFITTAGVFTQTAVTPTTGATHDWAHQGDGMYTIEIPDTGGASIDNDTEGFGWFTGFCTGVLPWRGPIIGFRAAGLNNLLIDSAYSATRALAGTALPDAVADAAGGLPISDAGGLDLDQIGTDTAAILVDTAVIGALGVGLTAVPWNSDWDAEVQSEVNDALIANNLDHLALTATGAADMTSEVADNTILSRILANGDTSAFVPSTDGLQLIRDKQTDIETDTAVIGALGAGLTAVPWNSDWDAEVESEVTDSIVAHNLDHLALTATAAADMTTEVADDTILSRMLSNGDTSAFVPSTDGLQLIRDKLTDIETDTAVIGALGAGLTAVPWNAAWDAEVQSEAADALTAYDPPTKGEMDTAHGLLATPAQVNAQVLDVLNVDTFAEPGQEAPTATTTLVDKIGYLFKFLRNKVTQSATELKVFDDAGSTADQKSTISDDGTTYTRGEIGSGP